MCVPSFITVSLNFFGGEENMFYTSLEFHSLRHNVLIKEKYSVKHFDLSINASSLLLPILNEHGGHTEILTMPLSASYGVLRIRY